jgi:hypothetical protein
MTISPPNRVAHGLRMAAPKAIAMLSAHEAPTMEYLTFPKPIIRFTHQTSFTNSPSSACPVKPFFVLIEFGDPFSLAPRLLIHLCFTNAGPLLSFERE